MRKLIGRISVLIVCLIFATPLLMATLAQDYETQSGPMDYLRANAVNIDYVELDEYLDPVDHGAKGKLLYEKDTEKFVFNGHGLDPGVHYALIAKGGMKPSTYIILGDGIAGSGGNIHLEGIVDTDSIEKEGGAPTFLVLYEDMEWTYDVDGNFEGWILRRNHPTEYLYGKSSLMV